MIPFSVKNFHGNRIEFGYQIDESMKDSEIRNASVRIEHQSSLVPYER